MPGARLGYRGGAGLAQPTGTGADHEGKALREAAARWGAPEIVNTDKEPVQPEVRPLRGCWRDNPSASSVTCHHRHESPSRLLGSVQ